MSDVGVEEEQKSCTNISLIRQKIFAFEMGSEQKKGNLTKKVQ